MARNGPRLVMAALALGLYGVAATEASADSCPDLMARATRLILVTTADMSTTAAVLRTFERAGPQSAWTARDAPRAAVVGANGLGWGWDYAKAAAAGEPLKQEGDKKTPAGIYRLGAPFGFAPSPLAHYIQLDSEKTYCVDALASPYYNQIVPRSVAGAGTSGEDMRSIELYRRGFVIDYPTNAGARGGSCIFLHVWRSPESGTAGCVASDEAELGALQAWAADAAIAILPANALARFARCLPNAD